MLFTFSLFSLTAADGEVEIDSDNSTLDEDICTSEICKTEAHTVLTMLDDSVDPCENFYQFACGGFINKSTIPDDKSSFDVSTILEQTLKEQLNEILNSTISVDDIHPFVCSKTLYQACLNEGEMH